MLQCREDGQLFTEISIYSQDYRSKWKQKINHFRSLQTRYARDGLSCLFPTKEIGLLTSDENTKKNDRQQLQFMKDVQNGKYDILITTWVRISSSNIIRSQTKGTQE